MLQMLFYILAYPFLLYVTAKGFSYNNTDRGNNYIALAWNIYYQFLVLFSEKRTRN